MVKKRNLIKRVYERGQERTVSSSVRKKTKVVVARNHLQELKPKQQQLSSKEIIQPAVPHAPALSAHYRPQERLQEQYQPAKRIVSGIPKPQGFSERFEFPSTYNITQLTLMAKDPYWIYAYWDISNSSMSYARSQMSDEEFRSATVVIRVYEVSLVDFNGYNANYSFDLDVGFHTNNWYINLWSDCGSFVADLGLRAGNGKFIQLARSNYVQTPRQGYAARSEQIWMKVDGDGKQAYTILRRSIKKPYRLQQQDVSLAKKKRRLYLSEDDIRLYYSRLSPRLRELIGLRLGRHKLKQDHRFDFIIEGETVWDRALLLKGLPETCFVKRVLRGASEILVVVGQREHVAGSFGASEFLQQKRKRQFFFEIGAELIVYGRTEPDAKVWLGTKNIELRADGTFTLRFALPDGNIPLEFTAESFDQQEKRRINTYVERRTEYPI